MARKPLQFADSNRDAAARLPIEILAEARSHLRQHGDAVTRKGN
jgi:hypothetical protein